MGNLREEVAKLQKEVREFEESLEVLKNPPRYSPQAGTLPPLDFLKLELAALRTEQEREQLLATANQSLQNAREGLARKEEELKQLESDCQAIANEMAAAGQQVVATQDAYRQALENFRQLALKHYPRWQELNPGSELYRELGRIEHPEFSLKGSYGILAVAAIARDLR